MIIVNCIVKENILVKASIDTSTDVNYISQKHIGELGITYHSESNRIVTPDTSYSTLGKVNLHIGFNDGEKYKTTPSEFIVVGPDWPDYFPDLVLGMPWLRENGVNFDMHNSLLTIDDNFTIPFEKCNLSKDYPEWLLKNLFLRGLSPKNTFKVLLDGLEVLSLDEIVESLSPEQAEGTLHDH
ncbi:hypothetical protein RhiirA4_479357 [Rhizophagus irregularis]|uniref:Gag-pol fusion protein n=1 Tax=Rhizophagus irregularis TaxID=588596 RepID=A0A2I1HGA7_9GLOM|nr:hypothetical protein RhiirA4_479357 [Rhizophagus irregularis]